MSLGHGVLYRMTFLSLSPALFLPSPAFSVEPLNTEGAGYRAGDRRATEGRVGGERDTVRGCLNTEGVQSGVFAAPRAREQASERAND